jgi:predicted permease
MISIFTSVAPVLALIMIGYVVRKTLIPDMNFWDQSNKLLYWVLMPTLLFYLTSTIDLDNDTFSKYAIVILTSFGIATVVSLIVTKLFRYDVRVISSVLQGSIRHNSFIVLALAGNLFGTEAIILATIGMAILITASNLVVVGIVVGLLRKKEKDVEIYKNIFSIIISIVKNPILLSICAGLIFSSLYGNNIIVLHDTMQLLGNSALPFILLVIGANMKIMRLSGEALPIAIAVLIKMIFIPIVLFFIAKYFNLTELETSVVVLFGVVPTAASSYSVARQLGGDYDLMASIITVQTLFSFISIPLLIGIL